MPIVGEGTIDRLDNHRNLQTEVQQLHRCLERAPRIQTHWTVSPIPADQPVLLV